MQLATVSLLIAKSARIAQSGPADGADKVVRQTARVQHDLHWCTQRGRLIEHGHAHTKHQSRIHGLGREREESFMVSCCDPSQLFKISTLVPKYLHPKITWLGLLKRSSG